MQTLAILCTTLNVFIHLSHPPHRPPRPAPSLNLSAEIDTMPTLFYVRVAVRPYRKPHSPDMGRIIAAGLHLCRSCETLTGEIGHCCNCRKRTMLVIFRPKPCRIKGHARTDLSSAPLLGHSQPASASMNNHDQWVCSQLDDSHHVDSLMTSSLFVGVVVDTPGTSYIGTNRRTAPRTWSDSVQGRPTISLPPARHHQRNRQNSPSRSLRDSSVSLWVQSSRPRDRPSKLPQLCEQLRRPSAARLVETTETD
ncbi:hypothetical protein J6590_001181 [Homalodisca vitripennis]|nr:hypothetical protein J6590_001181 [Homalodisca vitripennis]